MTNDNKQPDVRFEDMNDLQRRLHNAACVLDSDGDEFGFVGVMRDAIAALQSPSVANEGWVSVGDRLPKVQRGDLEFVIVAILNPGDGKQYVFAAAYLNEYELEDGNTGEPMLFTGWHYEREHESYDGFYMPIESPEKITHWREYPKAPDISASPQPPQPLPATVNVQYGTKELQPPRYWFEDGRLFCDIGSWIGPMTQVEAENYCAAHGIVLGDKPEDIST